jgi:disulfide bond formation protein DsbB
VATTQVAGGHELQQCEHRWRLLEYCFEERITMFAIFLILVLMWLVGMISNYTFGGAVHLLLVFALIALVIRLIQGRRVV